MKWMPKSGEKEKKAVDYKLLAERLVKFFADECGLETDDLNGIWEPLHELLDAYVGMTIAPTDVREGYYSDEWFEDEDEED